MTLLADVRPATLRTPAGTGQKLRVFVWADRVQVWGLAGGAATLRADEALTGVDTGRNPKEPSRGRPWTLTLTSGETWRVERGCGCSGGLPAALAALKVPEVADV